MKHVVQYAWIIVVISCCTPQSRDALINRSLHSIIFKDGKCTIDTSTARSVENRIALISEIRVSNGFFISHKDSIPLNVFSFLHTCCGLNLGLADKGEIWDDSGFGNELTDRLTGRIVAIPKYLLNGAFVSENRILISYTEGGEVKTNKIIVFSGDKKEIRGLWFGQGPVISSQADLIDFVNSTRENH